MWSWAEVLRRRDRFTLEFDSPLSAASTLSLRCCFDLLLTFITLDSLMFRVNAIVNFITRHVSVVFFSAIGQHSCLQL